MFRCVLSATKPTKLIRGAKKQTPPPIYTADDEIAITELGDVQKIIDAISADLSGYYQRIQDIGICNYGSNAKSPADCATPIPEVAIQSRQDSEQIYKNMVTRTITYSVDSLNLVSYSQQAAPNPTNKKALATVAITFADHPNEHKILGVPFTALCWEASAGVFFSTLPNRSFSVAPVYTGTVVTDNKIKESAPGLTLLPFAAANYRLTDDLPGRWKSNIYWTCWHRYKSKHHDSRICDGFFLCMARNNDQWSLSLRARFPSHAGLYD